MSIAPEPGWSVTLVGRLAPKPIRTGILPVDHWLPGSHVMFDGSPLAYAEFHLLTDVAWTDPTGAAGLPTVQWLAACTEPWAQLIAQAPRRAARLRVRGLLVPVPGHKAVQWQVQGQPRALFRIQVSELTFVEPLVGPHHVTIQRWVPLVVPETEDWWDEDPHERIRDLLNDFDQPIF